MVPTNSRYSSPGIRTAHPLEHLVVPGLHRQVDVLAHLGQIGHRLDYPPAHVRGMGRQESDAFQARNVIEPRQQVCQVRTFLQVVSVGVNRLSQHGDFLDAPLGKQGNFAHHLVNRAADLPAPSVGDDAKRAHQVAPVDDGNVGGDLRMQRGQGSHASFPVHG